MKATLDEQAVESARGYDRWFERGWGRDAWHVERQALRRGINATAVAPVAVDVGCGAGRSTQAGQTAAARVISVDRSQTMLTVARHRHVTPLIAARRPGSSHARTGQSISPSG